LSLDAIGCRLRRKAGRRTGSIETERRGGHRIVEFVIEIGESSAASCRLAAGKTTLEPILYVDTSEIREGKLEELKTAMKELVEFVETNEPRLIAYNVYLNEDGNQMLVVHVHSDSASLEFHLRVAGPLVSRVRGVHQIVKD
jgi:quinol monooxygenase YgiN